MCFNIDNLIDIINIMKVYHYTQDNVKAYRGFTEAEKSPLEESVYFLPEHATFQKVPEYNETTHIAVFNENTEQWSIIDKPKPAPEPVVEEIVNKEEEPYVPPPLVTPTIFPPPEEPNKEEIDPNAPEQVPVLTVDELHRYTEEDRAKSKFLLEHCDWTQLQDINITEQSKNEWNEYRKKLRNIYKDRKPTLDFDNMKVIFPTIERANFPEEPETEWID